MAIQVYRDIAAADGAEAVAQLVARLITNGFSFLACGNGASTRTAAYPGSAALLAAQLKNAPSSWVAWQRGSRTWSLQRSTLLNPDYSSWRYEYTATGTPVAGTGTSPDRITTTATSGSQYVATNLFRYIGPLVSGANATAVTYPVKCHILIDDAGPSFALIIRKTPFPTGNNGFFSAVFCDQVTSPIWVANPDPVVMGIPAASADTSDNQMVTTVGYHSAWRAFGTPSATWTSTVGLENPGGMAGSTTLDQNGQDLILTPRWAFSAGPSAGVIGTSTLFSLIQPGRTPLVGLTVGSALSHAAFWTVAVANDGSPLTA